MTSSDATTPITPRHLTGDEIALLAWSAETARAEALQPGDLYGGAGTWALVRETRPWGSAVQINHDPMVETSIPGPAGAGIVTDPEAKYDRIRAADAVRLLGGHPDIVSTLAAAGARSIFDERHRTVRAVIEATGPEGGANVSADGRYRYEHAVAELAADGSVERALAVRSDLTADHYEDAGEFDICELHIDDSYGVVNVSVLGQGWDSMIDAQQRAVQMLSTTGV